MEFENYQKLKEEVKSKDFFNNYKGLVKFTWYASFVANLFSILFAYFHASKMVTQAMGDSSVNAALVALIICGVVLTGIEFFKRFIFDKFSLELIRQKFKFSGSELGILGFVSLLLISASFYLSVNGAKEYAAKSDEIKVTTETTVQSYEDSITRLYERKIAYVDSVNIGLSNQKLDYDNKSEGAETQRDKRYYREQIANTQALIDKNDIKIKEIKKERDELIEKYSSKILTKADESLKSNEGNSVRFLIFSTIIEFFIIIGIFFKNYFSHKSVSDYEAKINKDPRYRNFVLYNQLLDVIYKADTKLGDTLPIRKEIEKILKINQIDLIGRELDDALKVLVHIGILQQRGPKKAIKLSKDNAKEAVKNYMKIE